MGDNYLHLVSHDANWCPDIDNEAKAVAAAKEIFGLCDELTAERSADPQVYDCGENFESVQCPRCGWPVTEEWGEWMDSAFKEDFSKLEVTTPCCSLQTNLNDLKYYWQPMAIAKWSLTIMNAESVQWPDGDINRLESILGTSLKVIRRKL
jgi:hypothetical protein